MRLIVTFLFIILSITAIFAQNPTDSNTVQQVDTLNNVDSNSIVQADPEPTRPVIDTLGLLDFDLQFEANQLTIIAKNVYRQSTIPNQFASTIELGGSTKVVLFEKGVAHLDYEASYAGELVSVRSKYRACKVKNCADCDPLTHPKEDEIICLDNQHTQLVHVQKYKNGGLRIQAIPLWWSIIPPLVAIFLALIFRQVLLALFMGILAGAWVIGGMQLTPYGLLKSFFSVIDHYIIGALNNSSHLSVIVFSIMIGGVVAIISRNGGMAGVVKKLAPLAKGPKSTQFVAWLLGVAIFFDDYANSLIVGNTIRPLTDKYKISREKLAYIVDSTAAPISAVAFITTWIGAELNYISDAMPLLSGLENPPSAYSMFLSSLPYSFYSFFTLIFILIIIFTGRDYGGMYKAECRARTTGRVFDTEGEALSDDDMEELEPVEGAPHRWINGFLPILMVVFGTLMGLIDTGMQASYSALVENGVQVAHNGWGEVWSKMQLLESSGEAGFVRKMGILIGNSDSYAALLWASMSAIVLALILTVAQGIMKLSDAIETVVAGFKTMMPALLILILAWALATTTEELSTAEFLTTTLGDSLSPYMVPVVVFILAAVIAFSTGSSWSTMAILYPIAIPLCWSISQNAGLPLETAMELLYNVIAVVLAASVLGDHCSPISDTTILSSLASNCNHIDHVKTQLPYALTVGSISITMTYVSTAFGIPFIISFVVGIALMFGAVMLFGKEVPSSNLETMAEK
ncbi:MULTISPECIES: Na+/H+ antiporter NhaC family protein [unclassified Aureispira]|uniref:Na+/H+ antiporter NhaC family protein n=1 Tax=unclassified Aureispira TaxID=2649989 RepID=UPI0006982341|nr:MULTISPECIES: Na+/H+ antiporter NhaC family protein [unclassified Aureispira]WMX13513.1 Na+/H+ antiporter NhaC family protein [Aureispira sp. CCB-E]